MSLHSRIKEARNRKGLTQTELGTLIGVAKTTIAGYERQYEPSAAQLGAIADALDVDVTFLLQDEIKKHHELCATPDEMENLVKKYRILDGHGKEIVDSVLDIEYRDALKRQKESAHLAEEEKIITLPLPLQPASAGTGQFADDEAAEDISVVYNRCTSKADYILRVSGDSMEPKFYDGDLVLVREQPSVELGETGIYIIEGEQFIKVYKGDHLHSLNPDYEDIDCAEDTYCRGKVIGVLDEDWIR